MLHEKKSYGHLGIEERALIQANLKLGLSLRAIGRELGRAASTISRELKRCGWRGPDEATPAWPAVGRGVNGYWCESAHRRALKVAAKPRVAAKLVIGNALWTDVLALLASGLSPQQVSGTLARMQTPQRINQTAYSALYALPRGGLRVEVLKLLRKSHKRRRVIVVNQ